MSTSATGSTWRSRAGGTWLLTVLAALATFFTLSGWSDMVSDPNGFLDPVGRIALVLVVVSVALRALPVGRVVVVLAQLYLLWVMLGTENLGLDLRDALLPHPATVSDQVQALQAGSEAAQRYPAPVPRSAAEINPLLVTGGVGILFAVDLLAVTLRRVPLAGLPLLAAFTVPVAILDGFPWLTFAVAGAFFVLLLAADHLSRLSQWGRTFVARRDGEDGSALGAGEALQRNGPLTVQIGAVALGAALLAPLAVPSYEGLLDGTGSGGDGDGRTVRLENPITDMQRDLDRGEDVDLLFVTTDDPSPSYLRLTALDEFDGDAWRPGRRDLPATQRAAGDLPPPVGVGPNLPARTYGYQLRATDDLRSTWLPLPFPATAANVPGDWRYDMDTRDVRSRDDDETTAGLSYEATGDVVDPSALSLVRARSAPATISRDGTELPWNTTPDWLERIVEAVTRDTDSDFAAAVAMQRWFRADDRFTYSTDNADGSGLRALRTFLTDERTGYCEQFATAMALMARVHGIPARVAVGMLRPEQISDGSFVFSTHDLHAWPELYFEGAGWVRFEPTPSSDQPRPVPQYTRGNVPELRPDDPEQTTSSSPTPTPTRLPRQDTTAPTGTTTESGGLSPWTVLGFVTVLVLLLLPRGLREVARRRRSGGDDPVALVEGAWAEVRATALDLGFGWNDRVTVRVLSRSLAQVMRRGATAGRRTSADDVITEPVALAALDSLVRAVERSRFSAHPPTRDDARAAAAAASTVVDALRQRVDQRTRLRADWLPRSILSPSRPAPTSATDQATEAAVPQEDQDSVSL